MAATTSEKRVSPTTPEFIKVVNQIVEKKMQSAQNLLNQVKRENAKPGKKK